MRLKVSFNFILIISVASILLFFIPPYINLVLLNPLFLFIAVIVSRFLAGFGVFSIFLNLSIFIMQYYAPQIKRKKEEAYELRRKLVKLGYVYAIFLLGYYIISILLPSRGVDLLFLTIGLVTIMVTVYIIPMWQEASEIKGEKSFTEIILEKANEVAIGFKKIYYEKLVRDYGKAIALEFMRVKVKMDKMRLKIAKFSYPLIAASITPILPVSVLVWYKYISLYILRKEKFDDSAKIIFLLSVVTLIVYMISVVVYEHLVIQTLFWQLPYIIGSAYALYMYHVNMK